MSDRKLQYGKNESKAITCGVPQGLVLGPLLWNLMYDDLLRVQTGGNVRNESSSTLVDDSAVVTTGRMPEILQAVTNIALEAVSAWMDRAELVLSVGKTEAVILTNKRAYTAPEFDIRGTKIRVKEQIKYLGVQLHRVLGFRAHLETTAARAKVTAQPLSRIMPNVGGTRQKNRRFLAGVVMSKILYAPPVWSSSLAFDRNIKIILRPQRTIALRTAMAYRTVSNGGCHGSNGIHTGTPTCLGKNKEIRNQNGHRQNH